MVIRSEVPRRRSLWKILLGRDGTKRNAVRVASCQPL